MSSQPSRFLAKPSRQPYWLLLIPLAAVMMLRWWSDALPLSPRGENVTQISYLWTLRRLWASGDALRGWNPLILGGQPTTTARVFHLHLTLAGLSSLLDLSPEWVFKGVQWLMTVLSGLGTYAYLRRFQDQPGAALVGAVVFMLFPARMMMTAESLFVACAWTGLPWVLWAYEGTRVPYPLCLRPATVWGVALAWVALTGSQWFLLAMAPLGTYVVLKELAALAPMEGQRPPLGREIKRLLISSMVAAAVAAGLCTFFYVPSLIEAPLLSTQAYLTNLPGTTRWLIQPKLLANLLVERWRPGFDPAGWEMVRIFPNMAWYLGAIGCVLALLGVARWRRWRRWLPLVGMLIASLLLTSGPSLSFNPAYSVVRHIPFAADAVRNAYRHLWPASIALAGLASLAVDGWLHGAGAWRQFIVTIALATLVVMDCWPAQVAYGTTASYLSQGEIEAHQWLDQTPGLERYWVPFQIELAGQHYAAPAYGARYNHRPTISDTEYHARSAPSRAAWFYDELLRGQIERPEGLSAASQAILDLASVRYMLLTLWPASYQQSLARLTESGHWRVLQQDQRNVLLENQFVRPLAHAYAGGIWRQLWTDAELLAALPEALRRGYTLVETPVARGAEKFQDSALILRDQAQPIEGLPSLAPPQVQLAFARPRATRIWLRYQAERPFLLMLSETWYPHWRVYVNGQRQALLRLNGNFQGVYVAEGGQGNIRFEYRQPWYVWLSALISLASLVTLIVYWTHPQPVRLRLDA